jgi:phosphoglycolate phosphatase
MPTMSAKDTAESSIPQDTGECGSRVPLNITVFCDLDGPLIDVSRRYYKTYLLAIAETQAYMQTQGRSLQLTPLNAGQFWQMKQERIPDADIAFRSGLRHEQTDLFLANVYNIVNEPILLREDRLQPNVACSLGQLRRLGVQLSVVTLRSQTQAEQILQQFRIAPYFKHIRGAEDQSAAYDNFVEGKQALLAELVQHVSPVVRSQYWIIGDTEADILAGQALGLSTVAVTCGIRSGSYLRRLEPTTVQPNLQTAVQYLQEHAAIVGK